MKKALLFVLSTLVGLLFIQPANAQGWRRWLGYDPLQEQVADNLSMVRELNAQYDINRALVGLSPRGYLYAGGYRDDYRGEYGQPIGRTQRTIETTAACAAIGAAAGGLKGLLYGSGGCLAGNALYDIFSGKKVQKLREAEARMIQAEAEREEREAKEAQQRADHEAKAEAERRAELEERQLKGGYLRNSSRRWNLEVTDCASADRPMTRVRVFVLRPGQRMSAIGAICGYEGTFFVRSTSVAGVVDEQVAAFIISDDAGGWVFHLPEVRQSQRGGR